MNISAPFIRKPVATTLLTVAVALAGGVSFRLLPVSPLPQVDFPTISVSASLPGASPETMAASVATPLERQFGRIAGVSEMTSSSGLGSTSITFLFALDRDIDAAARDVQAAINAARGNLPTNLPSNPTYRKVNPSDSPIFILALTSKSLDKGTMYDAASTILAQTLSQVTGVGQVVVGGSALPAVRVELDPSTVNKYGIGLETVRGALANANANTPKGHFSFGPQTYEVGATDQIFKAVDYASLIVGYVHGSAVRVSDLGDSSRFGGGSSQFRIRQRQAFRAGDRFQAARREYYRYRQSRARDPAGAQSVHPRRDRHAGRPGSDRYHSSLGRRR